MGAWVHFETNRKPIHTNVRLATVMNRRNSFRLTGFLENLSMSLWDEFRMNFVDE